MLRGIVILTLALGVRGDPASAAPEGCSSFSVSGAIGYSAEVGCCIDLNKIEYTPP